MNGKRHIGDGVYVAFDGYSLTITTEDGVTVTNRIVLEPETWDALEAYCAEITEAAR